MNHSAFSDLLLKPDLVKNLKSLGFSEMTPIQAQCLPLILQGQDVIGQAKTGSGKTAAFGLGLLQSLDVKKFRIQALVLCPTRELADQVASDIRSLARRIHNIKVLTLCGGVPFGPQKGSLEHGAHIIVGTPGRVEEHLRKGNLAMQALSTLVLDEADRMLDMGFRDTVETIIQKLPRQRQTLLFSATFPRGIELLADNVMNNAERITISEGHSSQSIRQVAYKIPSRKERTDSLIKVLLKHQPVSSLIFCNTKQLTEEVAEALVKKGFYARPLHGDFPQRDRDLRLLRFANKSISVLVATDVAARGLDIDALDLVVNYHLPRDPEIYTHRIGRTGRAGSSGLACSLFHESEENTLELLENLTDSQVERSELREISIGVQPNQPPSVTLQIDGGKKQKIRPGDLLGALTGEGGIAGNLVGKINIFEQSAYIALDRSVYKRALKVLQEGKVKGRSFKARVVKG